MPILSVIQYQDSRLAPITLRSLGLTPPPPAAGMGAPAFINNELKIITEKGNFDVFTVDMLKTAAPIGHLLDVIS